MEKQIQTRRFAPRVSAKVLLIEAALLWGFAGFKILNIAYATLMSFAGLALVGVAIGLIGYYFFFKGVFLKMYKKHSTRILSFGSEKRCMFSFFDKKGFLIMAFMITLGISLRTFHVLPDFILGTFYISLGMSLFSAGVCFLVKGFKLVSQ